MDVALLAPDNVAPVDDASPEPWATGISREQPEPDSPTYLHPGVVVVTAGGYAWTMLAFWVAFAGYGYMSFALFMATLISLVMPGSMAAGSVVGRDVTPWQRHWLSFREFLSGEVEVWGGRVSGRDAFLQLAGMSWCLAALATTFAVIVILVRP